MCDKKSKAYSAIVWIGNIFKDRPGVVYIETQVFFNHPDDPVKKIDLIGDCLSVYFKKNKQVIQVDPDNLYLITRYVNGWCPILDCSRTATQETFPYCKFMNYHKKQIDMQ